MEVFIWGGRRAAPFDAVEHIERRSKRSRPEAMPPDEYRNEGTPSLSEGPDAGARPFGPFWGVCQKGLAVRAKPLAAVTAGMDMYT